jgi:tRNA 2-thiouridine synthesizing protein E
MTDEKGAGNMGSIIVNGRTIDLGKDGYLANVDEWDEEVAGILADEEGIEMTERHWEVVHFLREYYRLYQIAPMIKILVKKMGSAFGPAKGNLKYLYELYPEGPAKQACKIAGLPRPTGCV